MGKNTKKTVTTKINNSKPSDKQAMIEEMETKIASMKEDKDAKCKAAKEQLIETLKITADKYRTATGTAEALRVLRFVAEGRVDLVMFDANELAWDMANQTEEMIERAESLPYHEMDQLCEPFYDKTFIVRAAESDEAAIYRLAFEMMRIDLCRNVGGAAEDMVGFIKRVEEEIDDVGEELKKLKEEEA